MGTRSAGDELIYSITPCSLFLRVVKLLLLGILHRDVKSWERGEYSNDILERSSVMFTVHTRQQMAEMVMRWSMFSAYSDFVTSASFVPDA